MRVARVIFVLGSAVTLTGATAATATAHAHASPATHSAGLPAGRPKPMGPAAADRTAISYSSVHYPGPGAARVLSTERDTDRGQAVYDVRVLAQNGATYVIHVSRASGAVLWANKAEGQASGRATGASAQPRRSEAERDHVHAEDGSTRGDLPQDG